MFDRTITLIGEEKFNKIKQKTVLIVGIGGVGGYATESLVRSGIHNLILIDHDNIDTTNLPSSSYISNEENSFKRDLNKYNIFLQKKDGNRNEWFDCSKIESFKVIRNS